jgi:hypothetical protein
LLVITLIVWSVAFSASAPAQDCNTQVAPADRGPLRAPLDPRPEALPDAATVEAGKRQLIDVLANDKGVPSGSKAELQIEENPGCGEAGVDGQSVWYRGGDNCAGRSSTFKYRAKLFDARTCESEWRSALVTVTVTAAPPRVLSCDIPGSRMVKIDGGQFTKAEAPPELGDFIRLVEEDTFTVAPFCLAIEETSAQEFEKFFTAIPESRKRQEFSEVFEQGADNAGSLPQSSAAATNISHTMAEAYAKYQSEASGRTLGLPTLNEYIAAIWELQRKRPQSPEATFLLVGLRSGSLQWTNSPCAETGNFLTLGPGRAGPITKLCYAQSRRDRMAFRLILR